MMYKQQKAAVEDARKAAIQRRLADYGPQNKGKKGVMPNVPKSGNGEKPK